VIKPHFQAADSSGFLGGLAAVCLNGKCGYIDRTGTFVIAPTFAPGVNTFSEGMASVRVNNKWGFINSSGKIVINPQFDQVTMFSGGLAAVSVSGRSGTINKQGKYVVNPGQYNIQTSEDDLLRVTSSDGVGLITRDGKWVVKPSKALTGIRNIFGKVFEGQVGGQLVPVSISGKVLAGPYKGAMLDTLGQDIDSEKKAYESMLVLINAELSYSGAYAVKGFTSSLAALGPAQGTPDENHAGLIPADLATGAKDGYQFAISIPAGTSTGGTNFNYFIVAKPAASHFGKTYCADSSRSIYASVQGEECTINSPVVGKALQLNEVD
jgi:hypothetical protein